MHLKINGDYAPHQEVANILPAYCQNFSLPFCIYLRLEGLYCALVDPLIFLIGAFCNPLTCYIFLFRMEKLNRNLIFLACLSMADTLKLMQSPFYRFPARGLSFISNGRFWWVSLNYSQASCFFYRLWHTVSGILVSSVFTVVSLDRFMSLIWPGRMSRVTNCQAWMCMIFTLVFAVGLSLSWSLDVGIFLDPKSKLYKCWRIHDSTLWNLASIFIYQGKLLFLLLVTIINVAMTVKIIKIVRHRRKLQEGQNTAVKMSQISVALVVAWQALFNFLANIFRITVIMIVLFSNIRSDEDTTESVWPLITIGSALSDVPCGIRCLFYMWRMPRYRSNFISIISCGKLGNDNNKRDKV